jgi:hypothetical protein
MLANTLGFTGCGKSRFAREIIALSGQSRTDFRLVMYGLEAVPFKLEFFRSLFSPCGTCPVSTLSAARFALKVA